MVSLASLSTTNARHVRSISLPTRSHPTILQVEEELDHLKSREASTSSSVADAETICGSLVGLKTLYASINDLISLPQTQQALSHVKDDKLVDELLDRSMSLLDVCGSIKEAMEQIKDHLRNTQSAFRRRKEGLIKSDSSSSLLKILKDAKRATVALKQIDSKIGGIVLSNLDHHLSSLITSVRDTSALSVSIFGSLVSSSNAIFMSRKRKSTKWAMVSGLIHKRKSIVGGADQPHISNDALGRHIEVIEESLESMSRTLIKARVSLLNIRSEH